MRVRATDQLTTEVERWGDLELHIEDRPAPEGCQMGYFDGLPGTDGDSLDFVWHGNDIESHDVYVAAQETDDGDFRQVKVMLGFEEPGHAIEAFEEVWPDHLGGVWRLSPSEFLEAVQGGERRRGLLRVTAASLTLRRSPGVSQRDPNHQRLYKRVWYRKDGGSVAWDSKFGTEGSEVSLKEDARVLEVSERDLEQEGGCVTVRTASMNVEDAVWSVLQTHARDERWEAAAKAIPKPTLIGSEGLDEGMTGHLTSLKDKEQLIEELRARLDEALRNAGSLPYDAIVTEDRLIILNPEVLGPPPERRRWVQ